MIEKKIDPLSVWFFENLLRHKGIGHFVSTRIGGCSNPPYDALNLSFNVGDAPKKVLKNRELLADTLGISLSSLTTAKQVHDAHVEIVTKGSRGKGATDYKGAINAADAMVTDAADTCLMALLADCVPILFYDPSRKVIGVAHAGWKGTLRSVARDTVSVFRKDFGCSPKDIVVGIGPSIGPCCYEVGKEVVGQVENLFGAKQGYIGKESTSGKGCFDLWQANLRQLVEAGIPEENIETAKVCTCHHPDLFFSYRHENGRAGRFGAGIVIR